MSAVSVWSLRQVLNSGNLPIKTFDATIPPALPKPTIIAELIARL